MGGGTKTLARSFSSHIAQLTWMFSRYTPSLCDRDAATRMQGEGGWTQTRWTAVVMMGPANIVSGSAARTRAISGSAFSSPAKNTHGSDQLHGWNQTNYNELESAFVALRVLLFPHFLAVFFWCYHLPAPASVKLLDVLCFASALGNCSCL